MVSTNLVKQMSVVKQVKNYRAAEKKALVPMHYRSGALSRVSYDESAVPDWGKAEALAKVLTKETEKLRLAYELESDLQRARNYAAATRDSFIESLLKRDLDDSGRLAGPKA